MFKNKDLVVAAMIIKDIVITITIITIIIVDAVALIIIIANIIKVKRNLCFTFLHAKDSSDLC